MEKPNSKPGLSAVDIETILHDETTNEFKKQARVGWRYYNAEHDIKDYRLFYFDADGILQEDKYRSNIKITHPFFTELADQEAQFALSNPNNYVQSDIPEVQDILDDVFGDEFREAFSEVVTGAIAKGSEYLFASLDENGELKWDCANSLNVIELPKSQAKDGRDHIIYCKREQRGKKYYKLVQDWTKQDVTYWIKEEKAGTKLELDPVEEINPRPHIVVNDGGKRKGAGFGMIPFFRLDNNRSRTTGLKPIKDLIDDYDLMACGLSNNIQDAAEVLYVVSGFQGDNLSELQHNIKSTKTVGTAPDGNVEIKTISIPYEARRTKMEITERNIYRFGMGFNSSQIGDGNVTNVVILSRYTLLDLKCNKLEDRLRAFMREVVKFVFDYLNVEHGKGLNHKDVTFDFTREVMTNALENAQIELTEAQRKQTEIGTLLSLMNTLPSKVLVKAICEVLDINFEEIKDKLPEDWEGLYEQASAGITETPSESGAGSGEEVAAELQGSPATD